MAWMKQHWRYLIARWGAHPAIWCLVGEGAMPCYLSADPARDRATQKHGWTEIARFVRATDARFITPSRLIPPPARNGVEDAAVLDFDMLQIGHNDRASIPNRVKLVTASRAADQPMAVIDR
jgi:hypothetical protein